MCVCNHSDVPVSRVLLDINFKKCVFLPTCISKTHEFHAYLHSVEEQLRNVPLEDAPAFPVQLHRSLPDVHLQVDDPVRLRLELRDLVVAVDAEGERRRLAGTEGDQVAVQVAVFVLENT